MTTQPTPNTKLRYAVRGVLVLGMAASVAANVLHADPNPISKVIAAWPPIALLLAIELVIFVPLRRRKVAWVRRGVTVIVAAIAAYVSYWHMVAVAARYGESGLSVFLLPVSVDGMIVVASICLVELSGRLRAESVDAVTTLQPEQATLAEPLAEPAPAKAPRPAPANTPRPVRKPSGQSVAASVQAAAGRIDTRDVETVWQEVRRTTHPDVSRDTVRRSLGRIPTNGHVHG